MNTFHLRVFQTHVLDQCRFLIMSAHQLNKGLGSNDTGLIFYALQNLLNANANISKLLWGQRGEKAAEREPLRRSIAVADDSPLRQVSMRNHFEHIDERIDRWWSESIRHNIADKLIGPRSMIKGLEPIDSFRWFDPASKNVIFWGNEFNIQSLVTEVVRILPLLRVEADKPHWDPPDR